MAGPNKLLLALRNEGKIFPGEVKVALGGLAAYEDCTAPALTPVPPAYGPALCGATETLAS